MVMHYDDLPRGIHIALGGAPMYEVVDSSFDAAILLGHLAMAGVERGVMAHTFSSLTIENILLNGRRIGEIAIEALWLGSFGIPVVMVSADEDGCSEARDWLGEVETAPTKRGLGTHRAISLHPADACDLIRARAAAAIARLDDFTPFVPPPPYELQFDCYTEEQARIRYAKLDGRAEMIGPRSFLLRGQKPLDLVW